MIEGILTMLAWLLGLSVTGIIGYLVYDELQYKHKAIVKTKTSAGEQVQVLKAKQKVDKDGSLWWRIKKFKKPIPRPPNKYLELTDKGNYFALFYQLSGGELHPSVMDDFQMDEGNAELMTVIQPLTTSQRQILVDQQMKINRDKKKGLAEVLTYAVPFIAVVLIVVVILIFWDEAMQPMIELGKTNEAVLDKMATVADKLDTVINNRVHVTNIETPTGAYNLTPPN